MRKYLLATSVLAALATPAFADVSGPYVGVEGGVTFPRSSDLDVILNDTSATPPPTATFDNGYKTKFKTGYDLDAVAGYKLGLIKLEVEGGYKRANVKSLGVSTPLITAVGDASGTAATAG